MYGRSNLRIEMFINVIRQNYKLSGKEGKEDEEEREKNNNNSYKKQNSSKAIYNVFMD